MVATEDEVEIFEGDSAPAQGHYAATDFFREIDAAIGNDARNPSELERIEAALIHAAEALHTLTAEPRCGLDRATRLHALRLMKHWDGLARKRSRLLSS